MGHMTLELINLELINLELRTQNLDKEIRHQRSAYLADWFVLELRIRTVES